MIYWDSSALVAAFIQEASTKKVLSFLVEHEDTIAYTAVLTPLEVDSALQRKLKERALTLAQVEKVRDRLREFRKGVSLIAMDINILDSALHLQKIYGLRLGDSIQLASARAGTNHPASVHLLCLDEKLSEAARKEGFLLLE